MRNLKLGGTYIMMLPSQYVKDNNINFAFGFLANFFGKMLAKLKSARVLAAKTTGTRTVPATVMNATNPSTYGPRSVTLVNKQRGLAPFFKKAGETALTYLKKPLNYVRYGAVRTGAADQVIAKGAHAGYVGSRSIPKMIGRGLLTASILPFKHYDVVTGKLPSMMLRKAGFTKTAKLLRTVPGRIATSTAGMIGIPYAASRIATRGEGKMYQGPAQPQTYNQNVQYSEQTRRFNKGKNSNFSTINRYIYIPTRGAINRNALGRFINQVRVEGLAPKLRKPNKGFINN